MRDSVKEEKGGGEPRTGEQIVRVRLVAEGSTRGKERHEIERFLGLAGTLSRWISRTHLSLPPSICSFVVPIFAIFPINSPRTSLDHRDYPLGILSFFFSPPSSFLSLS